MNHMLDQLKHLDDRFGETTTENTIKAITLAHESPDEFMEMLVTFANVLKAGKYKSMDYVKAVQYCTYRSMDLSMKQCYMQTFPDRCYRDGERKPEGTIDASASLYDKTRLVQSIISQMQVPLHLIMMGERVNAAKTLARLMVNSDSERIQMESADKLLNHIQIPETVKIELDVGVKADETLQDIGKSLDQLAQLAQAKITQGALTPLEVIES